MSDVTMRNAAQPVSQRGLRGLVLGVVVALSATVALSAWAGGGGGHHGGGFGGHGMMMGSPERMGRGIDRMLDRLDATDAQRAQIKQIVQAAAADLKAQREANRGLRERGMQVFTAPNVDANAAEAVRKQMIEQHDQSSKRMMLAMIEISRVLTPEQRAKIAERMKARSQRHERQKQ